MSSQPNVLWITLESTRADHTSLDGYDRDTTPNLEAIAEAPDGRAFEDCISHGVWTLPSSSSILTATYPSRHGAGMGHEAIPESFETVPERLKAAGYATACLSPNSHLSSATGLDRGFDRFSWVSSSNLLHSVGIRSMLRYAGNLWKHGAGLSFDPQKQGPDFMMADQAKRWIRSFAGREEPAFLYVHFGGPHRPYYPPRRFAERFTADLDVAPEEAGEFSLDVHDRLFEYVAKGCPFSDEEWASLKALYDGEIAHADELAGHLVEYARDRLDGETIVVVTADHGELFGEGGLLAHQISVDDAVVRVPLVVRGLDAAVAYDGDQVQHADVMRTILERVGADTDGLQGIDLASDRRTFSIVQRGAERCQRNLERISELGDAFDPSRYQTSAVTAIRKDGFKLVKGDERSELYRLGEEETDVADEHSSVQADLEVTLDEWIESEGRPTEVTRGEAAFSESMKEQLADLGYLVD